LEDEAFEFELIISFSFPIELPLVLIMSDLAVLFFEQ
jgi:hypothetical protein